MAEASDGGFFQPVDLFRQLDFFDTSVVPAFDESPNYDVRQHVLSVKVRPVPGQTDRQAVTDLAATA